MSELLHGLPPIIGPAPRVLVLGNMPSVISLATRQYYGNPRNSFWRICADLFDLDAEAPYEQRTAALVAERVAVWDVLRECRRIGSLDAAVEPDSMVPNAIGPLLQDNPSIELIAFNGGAAARNHRRLVHDAPDAPTVTLPSTSPAHTIAYGTKLAAWRAALG